MSDNDFYIGYLPKAPQKYGKLAWISAIGLVLLGTLIAGAITFSQPDFPASTFEFGVEREFEGVITESPYPVLNVLRPGVEMSMPQYSPYYLVVFGKSGAQDAVKGLNGKRVKLRGSLIYREQQTMIEILDGSVEVLSDVPAQSAPSLAGKGVSLGEKTLTGEIVDSKCFLGVMNPGELKLHKACATLCIAGGIPPVLVVRNQQSLATYFMLVSRDGQAVNEEVLPLIATPVNITGEVIKYGDLLVLKADPATYQRL